MAYTRQLLYAETCDFLKEGRVAPTATSHPLVKRIAEVEESAAAWLLGEHPWNFASTVVRLQKVAEEDPDADEPNASLAGFRYAYMKPPIAKTVWVSSTPNERGRLTRGWDDQQGRILSDHNPLYLKGVMAEYATAARIGYWTHHFGTAVASLLGDRLTGPVTNSRGWSSDASARSLELIERAFTHDAGESPAPRRRTGSWGRSRYGRLTGRD